MACNNCANQNVINDTNVNNVNNDYIYNTLHRIDQIQKEATCVNRCEGCEGGLLSQIFNTKPISIYLAGGVPFNVINPDDLATTTNLFRIENINGNSVILRLLVRTEGDTPTITCLNHTVVLRINCICALQCFAPICCERCPGCAIN